MKNQAVILAAAHESTRLLFVVGQPLGQETHLTVSMSAAQTDPAEVFRQNQVPLFIQQLRAEIATTVQHVETLLSTLFPFTLFRNESRWLVSPPTPCTLVWVLKFPEPCGLEVLGELFGFVASGQLS